MSQHGPRDRSLSSIAARKKLLCGTALCTSDLFLQPLTQAILRDCNLVTSEFEMKWDALARHPQASKYQTSDKLVAFASDNGLAFHGHTLWWHESIPAADLNTSDEHFAKAALDRKSVV